MLHPKFCSCHFSPEDFIKRLSFGNVKYQRKNVKDELGILPVPKFHRNTWGEEEELSHQSRYQVSLPRSRFEGNRISSSPQTPAYPSATFLSHCLLPKHPSQSPLRHCLMTSNQISGFWLQWSLPFPASFVQCLQSLLAS